MDKKILFNKHFLASPEKIVSSLRKVLESEKLSNNGPQLLELEHSLSKYFNVPLSKISLYSNGTIALLIGLKTLNLKGSVLVTPFTFPATVSTLNYLGLDPIFCDIDEETLCISPLEIIKNYDSSCSAILGTHVYGNLCDVNSIQSFAKKKKLKTIYDAAHTFSVKKNGKSVISNGDLSMMSFHSAKIFNTIEGGVLYFKNIKDNNASKLNRNFGIVGQENVLAPGINGKLNELQAAVGIENLKEIDSEIQRRKKILSYYFEFLNKKDFLKIVTSEKNHSLQYFPVRLAGKFRSQSMRNHFFKLFKSKNIFSRKYFYPLISNFKYNKYIKSASISNLPVANKVSEEILCLPFHGELSMNDIKKISNVINNF